MHILKCSTNWQSWILDVVINSKPELEWKQYQLHLEDLHKLDLRFISIEDHNLRLLILA